MLGAYVLISKLTGFEKGELKDPLRARRERDVSCRRRRSASDVLLDLRTDRRQGDPEGPERSRADPLAFGEQTEQEMLRPDVVMVEESSFLLGEHHDAASPIREPLEHVASVLSLVAGEADLAVALLQLLDV